MKRLKVKCAERQSSISLDELPANMKRLLQVHWCVFIDALGDECERDTASRIDPTLIAMLQRLVSRAN